MKRRLIQQGRGTLTVSTPSTWAKKLNLKAGDEVEVLDHGNELVITTGMERENQPVFFDLRKLSPEFFRYFPNDTYLRHIDVLYRQGIDTIKISFSDARVIKYIEEKLEELPGFEIIEQTAEQCTIKCIAVEAEKEFNSILNRLFYLVIETGNELVKTLKTRDLENLSEIQQLEKTNNKFTNLCERILCKRGYKDLKQTPRLYTMVSVLEQIGDDLACISFNLQKLKKHKMTFGKDSLNFFEDTIKLISSLYKLFNSFDRITLFHIMKNRHYRINNVAIDAMLQQKSEEELILLHYASSILSKAYHLAESLDQNGTKE